MGLRKVVLTCSGFGRNHKIDLPVKQRLLRMSLTHSAPTLHSLGSQAFLCDWILSLLPYNKLRIMGLAMLPSLWFQGQHSGSRWRVDTMRGSHCVNRRPDRELSRQRCVLQLELGQCK